MQRSHEYTAEVLLLVVVLIWASNFTIAKFAMESLNPFLFNGLRYDVALIVIAIMFITHGRWVPVAREDRWPMVRLGLISSLIYQLAFIVGLSMTSAGNSAVLLSTAPLWTVVFSRWIHREAIARNAWIGMCTSLGGVTVIIIASGKKIQFGDAAILGDLLAFGAAVLWGLNTNLQKPLLGKYSALQLTLLMMAFGAGGLSLVALPTIPSVNFTNIHWSHWLAAAVSGVLSIGTANLFWSYGIKRIGPRRTASFNNLVPVLAFIISYVALDEAISTFQVAGACITIFGVWLAKR